MKKNIIFTCGDINGIGPEIIIKSLIYFQNKNSSNFCVICPPDVFKRAIKITKSKINYSTASQPGGGDSRVTLIPVAGVSGKFGAPTKISGRTAYNSIKKAVEFASAGLVDAIVTAPISKKAINMAGIDFPGHTEMLAEWTGTRDFVMTFLSKKMRASLVTIHKPLKMVPAKITEKNLHATFNVVLNSLKNDLNIPEPSVAVLGLNPHAGESGILGEEEERVIKPAINNYIGKEYFSGPYSPDAFFANRMHSKFDMVIGMYHDQVLIPFKLLNFGGGVNYTAGLPIVRTSPDHGVAYDIAGKNLADPSSFIEAVKYAEKIVNSRNKNAKKAGIQLL